MPELPRFTPWAGSSPPPEHDLRRILREEGQEYQAWSNGPFDVYTPHRHGYDKVLYCVSGSITFKLAELGVEYELFPGDRLDLPAGVLHGAEVGAQGVVCFEAHT